MTVIIFVCTTIRSIVFVLMGLIHADNWNELIRIFCKNYSALLYVDVARIYGKEKTPWNAQTCYIYVCEETVYMVNMLRMKWRWNDEKLRWGCWRGWWWERQDIQHSHVHSHVNSYCENIMNMNYLWIFVIHTVLCWLIRQLPQVYEIRDG